MGSPLRPVLAGIIMVELENSLVAKLISHLRFRKRYIDDHIMEIVKEGSINYVHQQLNSFHPNMQFSFEMEKQGRILSLDISIIRKKSSIETTVYRKSTDTGIYLNCFPFASNTCNTETKLGYIYRNETGFQFPNYGQKKFDHKHDLVCYIKCP